MSTDLIISAGPELVPFKEPRALAGMAAKLPALFLPNKQAAERFFGFLRVNSLSWSCGGFLPSEAS